MDLVLGQIVGTPAATDLLVSKGIAISTLLNRYTAGDWGDLCADDMKQNDKAIEEGTRILASYDLGDEDKVWIITEWDRSVTTLLLPSDY